MASRQCGVTTDFTTTEAGVLPLGFEYETDSNDGSGIKVWRWVQMTGSAAAAGEVVARAVDATTHVVALAIATTDTRYNCSGVAQHAIAQNSYGFVLRKGLGTIKTDGGVAAGGEALAIHSVAGETDTMDTAEENLVVGVSNAADVGDVTTAWIDIP